MFWIVPSTARMASKCLVTALVSTVSIHRPRHTYSLARFRAFTIQNAAYVRALGQIELIFTVIASALFFKERTSAR